MKLLKSVFVEYPMNMTVYEFELGKKSSRGVVKQLLYNEARGHGDAHYVDVEFEDGEKMRIFRPDMIEFLVEV